MPKKGISKEDFLTILSSMSIEEINQMIRDKGKKQKPIIPAYFVGGK